MNQQQPTPTHQTVPPIVPIDPMPIVEHGESPTAIILAIAILITALVGSVTNLVRVLVWVMLQRSTPSR
ncbi:hypothetical protein [Fischerella sp. PCC 9605]|uniref:hypothetical protein n=1 Tax=Fischerella sp. PCC 9605 TaxID=1173024 RepID=UPI00047DAAC0|nr:hypothetical protein [Fischerella sp. PCC 9605]